MDSNRASAEHGALASASAHDVGTRPLQRGKGSLGGSMGHDGGGSDLSVATCPPTTHVLDRDLSDIDSKGLDGCLRDSWDGLSRAYMWCGILGRGSLLALSGICGCSSNE